MRIFLSSAFKGLQQIRQDLSKRLETAGHSVSKMEIFGARPETPLETCLADLRKSDLLILIIGTRYGSAVPGGDISYTHKEFREAVTLDIPIIAFVLTDDVQSDQGAIEK